MWLGTSPIGLEAGNGCVLKRMPKSSVLLEFVGCPYQPNNIPDTATHRDAPGPVVPPKDQGVYAVTVTAPTIELIKNTSCLCARR